MVGVLLAIALLGTTVPQGCGLRTPVAGEIVREYAPIGRYAGHWGIDFAAPFGTIVRAAGPGVVTFAGSVAGRLSVTIHHGGGVRTSVSYLSEITTGVGSHVTRGEAIGRSGIDHGLEAVHLSVRVGDAYVDPRRWLGCGGRIRDGHCAFITPSGPHLSFAPCDAASSAGHSTRPISPTSSPGRRRITSSAWTWLRSSRPARHGKRRIAE